jgi:type IV pilus assembly protein PilY1
LAGKITQNGYSATVSNNIVTITGPAGAAGFSPTVNKSGSDTYATSAFVINSPPVISSITVNGVQLMSASAASASSTSTTAANIAARINQNGYTAVASSNNVVITGPTSAANYVPVITATSGITFTTDVFPETSPAKLTNFANWYSYYRTRMLMMKTSAGQAFSGLDNGYRAGLMQINNSVSSMVQLGTFETTKRDDWYTALYAAVPNNSTPLREALANAGRYYAGKQSSVTDPAQYSCQQNFTILSTDGYWNGNAGFMVDGSTDVGNQDDTAPRPYYDGAVSTSTWTYTYTRDFYSKVKSGCGSGNRLLSTQTQEGTCTLGTATGSCTPTSWSSRGAATISGTCNSLAAPAPTAAAFESVSENTTGGSSDTLADVAMYYYQTDLRTPALGNCGTPISPATVGPLCEDNVFKSASDNNAQQHMTTFTLGLGASGKMSYSADYLKAGANPDYTAVRLGSNASSTVCKWQTAGTTCNWPIPGDNLVENIDDLWHAAVNGRGVYFSASNPDTLATGLSSALAGVNAKKGAAAAAATSTLNPVSGNNAAYVASYTTNTWTGNLEARAINTDTGVVSERASWCVESVPAGTCATTPVAQTTGDTTIYNCETPVVGSCPGGVIDFSGNLTSGVQYCKTQVATACSGTMPAKVGATSDTRNIKTANAAGTALINFDAAYATANPSHFDATKLAGLTQWSSLTSDVVGPPAVQGQRTRAVGANLLNYLRGQYGYEDRTSNSGPPDNQLFRNRTSVMGDALESQPAYMGPPVFSYPYPIKQRKPVEKA